MRSLREPAAHGTRSCYVGGCRCDKCKSANSEYNRQRRSHTPGLASVTPLPAAKEKAAPATKPGRVEAKVIEELAGLNSVIKHPGLAESALSMARILDNQQMLPTHPAAQRALRGTLADLHDKASGQVGRLQKVAAMTGKSAG